ncbi:aldo/keto reductase [Cohaesibacter celericrescens]|uniref:Aldo/keto reductase n=1 Tax=Cohaesibacter celericrescens TaxID=2067669 RepID=A0A2N5XP41_9HYPH|nr:aldo/keto reductase [Cohaesibacter celericrescens]PLW76296.1 aldo/keto reductase [Cohaesibacter celericrescens]
MHSRNLGAKGFKVSEVGLGCWQLGADWGAPLAEDAGLAILETALQKGVTFFDTADVYGGGKSELLIGKFLKNKDRGDIRVATKFGRGDPYPDGYTEASLRKGIDESRARLGMDCLDLVQLHCIPTQVMRDGAIFDWLRTLQSQGVIRHFGASVETVEEGLLCIEQDGLLSLQVIYNLFRQKLTTQLLPKAKEKGVGIIVRLPLASGILSGKFSSGTVFAENDHRNFNRDGQAFNVGETFAGVPFETGLQLVNDLKEMLPEGMELADFAQRWILDHDAISTIIPGASKPQQIDRNAAISALPPLSDATHRELATFYEEKIAQHVRGAY